MQATELDVRFSELDPYGHVNHAVYLNYFEMGRIDALRAAGFSLAWLQEEGFHLLVVDVGVAFRAPAMLDDRLTVRSALSELRSASARWEQRILRGDEELASATVRTAITDRRGRPCRAPRGLREALQTLRQ